MPGEKSSGEVHREEPVTDYDSKSVMIRAERYDLVEIDGHGEFSVVQRTDTYFGPKIKLVGEDGDNYLLTAPGFHRQLQLWEGVVEDGFVVGWKQTDEVTAEIVNAKQYDICPQCGDPLASIEHERAAAFGTCPGDIDDT